MSDLTRYAYDPSSGIFVGEVEAQPDPLDPGNVLEPAFVTSVAPPITSANQAAIWNGAGWGIVPDYRGQTWFDGDRPVLIDALGDPAVQGLTAEAVERPRAPRTSCSKLGLKRAFDQRNLWPTVRAMIASDADMQEEWDLAIEIRKSDPLIGKALAGLAQHGIAMSDADVDKLIADAVAAVAPQAA